MISKAPTGGRGPKRRTRSSSTTSECMEKAAGEHSPRLQVSDYQMQVNFWDSWLNDPTALTPFSFFVGLLRCGKSCRLRWINYLRPDVKRGNFQEDEADLIIKLHALLGNRYAI